MVKRSFAKSTFVLVISLFFFSALLAAPARAREGEGEMSCGVPFKEELAGLELLSRASVDPTPGVIPLFYLPRDECGYVDWAKALRQGLVTPRDSIEEKYSLDKAAPSPGDIVIRVNSPSISDVLFAHDTHNEVLDCKSCHPSIFRKEAGTTNIRKAAILEGEYCGRCHGKVAFPLSNCSRCHDGSRKLFTSK